MALLTSNETYEETSESKTVIESTPEGDCLIELNYLVIERGLSQWESLWHESKVDLDSLLLSRRLPPKLDLGFAWQTHWVEARFTDSLSLAKTFKILKIEEHIGQFAKQPHTIGWFLPSYKLLTFADVYSLEDMRLLFAHRVALQRFANLHKYGSVFAPDPRKRSKRS